MIESLYIAESGLNSQQQLIEIISNNIANNTTPSFKRTEAHFVDLVYGGQQIGGQEGDIANNAVGAGSMIKSTQVDFSLGSIKQTGNPFDIAINGNGFLEVTSSNGDYGYTRAGRLRLDQDGYLTTSEGNRLSANIQVPPDSQNLFIDKTGVVSAQLDSNGQLIELGKIEVAHFTNTDGLVSAGENLYRATEESGFAIYQGQNSDNQVDILQGFTEMSNVSLNEEMVNLMLAQRGYQLNARIIQVTDQVMETINNLRR